jgi:UrcA family protein
MRKIFVLVSCVLVAFTVQAQAKEAYKNKTVAVDHADLDLSNPADAEVLRQRVDRAVKKACKAPYDNGMVLGTTRDKRRCMIWTREQAMAAISNEAQLAARPTSVRADRQIAEVAIPNQVVQPNHEQRVERAIFVKSTLRSTSRLRTFATPRSTRVPASASTATSSAA